MPAAAVLLALSTGVCLVAVSMAIVGLCARRLSKWRRLALTVSIAGVICFSEVAALAASRVAGLVPYDACTQWLGFALLGVGMWAWRLT
jgi:hypothetical protein